MHFSSFFFSLAGALLISSSATAHDYKAGEIHVDHPYARATAPGQPSGAVYLTLENKGKQSDKLLSVSSPAARSAEIHSMSMDGNIMKMREVTEIELKPSAKISMKPGDGYHIMLLGLKQPLKIGDKLPLSLTFEKSGKVDASFWVEEIKTKNSDIPKKSPAHHHH